jgi:hypothetical protein
MDGKAGRLVGVLSRARAVLRSTFESAWSSCIVCKFTTLPRPWRRTRGHRDRVIGRWSEAPRAPSWALDSVKAATLGGA